METNVLTETSKYNGYFTGIQGDWIGGGTILKTNNPQNKENGYMYKFPWTTKF